MQPLFSGRSQRVCPRRSPPSHARASPAAGGEGICPPTLGARKASGFEHHSRAPGSRSRDVQDVGGDVKTISVFLVFGLHSATGRLQQDASSQEKGAPHVSVPRVAPSARVRGAGKVRGASPDSQASSRQLPPCSFFVKQANLRVQAPHDLPGAVWDRA